MASQQSVRSRGRGSRRPRGELASPAALERHSRAERAVEIERLDGEGRTTAEIADELGLARSTVNIYRRDPSGEVRRRRQEQYGSICRGCAEPTSGAGPERAARWCQACAPRRRRRWSDEQMLEAIRDWVQLTGGPPAVADWSPAHAARGNPGAHRYLTEPGRWPSTSSVARRFGSLRAAIDRAGVSLPGPDGRA